MNMIIGGLVVGMVISDIALMYTLFRLQRCTQEIEMILRHNIARDEVAKQLLSNQSSQADLNNILTMAISELQDRIKEKDKAIIFQQKMGQA